MRALSKKLVVVSCLVLTSGLGGCSKNTDENIPLQNAGKSNRLERMTLEEREDLAPNALFQAVYEEDLAAIKKIVVEKAHLTQSQNIIDRDLPLGVAIKLRLREIALYLVEVTPQSHYNTPNARQESLFFLASREGMPEVITALGNRYFTEHWNPINIIYGIGALDFADENGQYALHVAANRQVVEALDIEHHRGYQPATKLPYFFFYLKTDHQGQNFVHTAASSGRTDVLRLAVEKFCNDGWAESPDWWVNAPGHVGNFIGRSVQYYTPWNLEAAIGLEAPFNYQDHEGRTPLHLAAIKADREAVEIFDSCKLTDFDLTDNKGDRAFHAFMKVLDKREPVLKENLRQILNIFIHGATDFRSWEWGKNQENYVNAPDSEGNTPMHYAAALADPWFYQKLFSESGKPEQQNKFGLRPVDIYAQKQGIVK